MVPRTPFNPALYLLIGMVGVSLWASFDVSVSLDKVTTLLVSLVLFWAVAGWVSTPARFAAAISGFLLTGTGLALAGLLGTRWQDKWPIIGPLVASWPTVVTGVPGAEAGANPNALGGALVLFLPAHVALLWWWLRARRTGDLPRALAPVWVGTLLALSASLVTVVLLATQSRGAWAGLAAAGLLAAWVHSGWRLRLALAAGVGATAWALRSLMSGPSFESRLEIWSRAWQALGDVWLTGMGLGTFRDVLPQLYPVYLTPADVPIAHAHNQFLQTGLDVGVPGLAAYVVLWVVAAITIGRAWRAAPASGVRTVAAGLGAGLTATLVFGLTDAIPLGAKVGVCFWLALALVAALPVATRYRP